MLENFKSSLWKKVIEPWVVRKGFRPAKAIPLEQVQAGGALCGYDEEVEIRRAAGIIQDSTKVSFERIASLWQQVRYLDRYEIPGSFVECGTWKGGCVGLMALAHLHSRKNPQRELHLFDSFEGLPEPDAKVDGNRAVDYASHRASGSLKSIGKCVSTLEDSQNLIEKKIGYPGNLTHYHAGWFQNTLPQDARAMGPISLLRLDGDWYESTMICLEHLYPKVVKGGVVIIDDYGHFAGCKKAVDEYLSKTAEPVSLNHIDYTGRFWIKLGD